MLTFEQIEDCFPLGSISMEDGWTGVTAQWLHDFAHAIAAKEREACAKVCDPYTHGQWFAAAIRARSNAQHQRRREAPSAACCC